MLHQGHKRQVEDENYIYKTDFCRCYLMLELKHVRGLGYVLILEQTTSRDLNILTFIRSFC